MADAPLDMRMDRSQKLTAYDIVNYWPENELERIIAQYGEEKFAKRISRKIAEAREIEDIKTTGDVYKRQIENIAQTVKTGG